MTDGTPATWAARLRSLDVRFLQRVVDVWPECLRTLPDQPREDDITFNLVVRLRNDRHVRKWFHFVAFQYHPPGYESTGRAYSKGRIDVAVLLLDPLAEGYLAYECKRLNDVREDGRRSLAGEYVMEGLSRFVAEQYSENLPVGCMLGYVLDGDVAYAASRVRGKIIACRREIALIGKPKDEAAVGVATRFSSRHRRQDDGEIEIRHALLPMRPGGTAAGDAPGRGHDEGAARDGASTASAAPADPRGGRGAPASLP